MPWMMWAKCELFNSWVIATFARHRMARLQELIHSICNKAEIPSWFRSKENISSMIWLTSKPSQSFRGLFSNHQKCVAANENWKGMLDMYSPYLYKNKVWLNSLIAEKWSKQTVFQLAENRPVKAQSDLAIGNFGRTVTAHIDCFMYAACINSR